MTEEQGKVETENKEDGNEITSGQSDAVSEKHDKTEDAADKVPVYVPGSTAVDITPDKDGGVTKEILRPGTGDDGPLTNDTVFVHYVGSLTDGTKFDSSRDRDDLFEFSLGKGSVIKAWDLAVATMKRGELCVIQCSAEYGYGKKGSKPKIPPNATLVFEIELFNWKGEDISEAQDGGILRSIITEGEDYQTPKDMTTCNVHVTGKFGGRVFEDRDVTFVVGEADEAGITAGIEQAAKKSRQGEKSKLVVKPKYGYGSEGNVKYGIPPDASLDYEIQMKSFEPLKESWQIRDIAEKLEQSENLKNKGTNYFKAGNYKRAIAYYEKIVEHLKDEEKLKDDEAEGRNQLLLAAHLNIAMCHLKLQDDIEACHSCDSALKVDPKNEKGLFRRGTANLNLHNYEDAVADFKVVLELDPQNKAAKNQMAIASHKIKEIRDKEKKTYAGMFDRFASADAKKAETLKVWKDGDKPEEPNSSNEDAPKEDSPVEHKEEPKQDLPSDSGDHTGVTA